VTPPHPSTMHEPVALWFDGEVPVRLVHAGRRWRVTDRPTRLWGEPTYSHELLTHPPRGVVGWRFQATSTDRTTHMFEVVRDDDEHWRLTRVYD